MRKKKIRFGVIGTSNITELFLKAAKNVADFELKAVYSRTKEKGEEFAGKYGVDSVFTDLEDMAKSKDIDAVYIASPNSFHAEQSIMFLNNKKHVLCEKAVASNTYEVSKMIEAAKKNDVVLMEAMRTTVLPNFNVIKDNLYKIGTIRKYFASYCQYSSRYDKYKEGIILNAFKKDLSNGALMDIGIYCIHPMVNIFGKPNTINANAIMLDSGVDGEGSLIFKYDEMDAVIMYSKISNSYLPSEIQGENGSIIIDKINNFNKVKIIFKDGTEEDLTSIQEENDMFYELEKFIGFINRENLKENDELLKVSRNVMEVMDQARLQIGLKYLADDYD